jgi:hypothetical protein
MIIPKCPELISWSTRGITQHQSVANAKKREKTAMMVKKKTLREHFQTDKERRVMMQCDANADAGV